MKSGSRAEGRAAVVGFESSQWLSMTRRRKLLGQALSIDRFARFEVIEQRLHRTLVP
jgi:hypothetical protein